MKICTHCNRLLDSCEFYANPGVRDGLGSWCKTCDKSYQSGYRKKNRKKLNLQNLCLRHHISVDVYLALIENGCEACGSTENLQVDHDHKCCPGQNSCGKCVRGCLCGPCNSAFGILRDDPQRLVSLLEYATAKVGS